MPPIRRRTTAQLHANHLDLQTAGVLAERLQAWKHAVVYLEDYIGSIEKIHHAQAKEYEKALKVCIQCPPNMPNRDLNKNRPSPNPSAKAITSTSPSAA